MVPIIRFVEIPIKTQKVRGVLRLTSDIVGIDQTGAIVIFHNVHHRHWNLWLSYLQNVVKCSLIDFVLVILGPWLLPQTGITLRTTLLTPVTQTSVILMTILMKTRVRNQLDGAIGLPRIEDHCLLCNYITKAKNSHYSEQPITELLVISKILIIVNDMCYPFLLLSLGALHRRMANFITIVPWRVVGDQLEGLY